MLAAGALVAAAALLPVAQSSNTTTTGYELHRLETRKADLQAAIYNAQTDIAELGSLARVEREARGRLSMVPAERTTLVQVGEPAPEVRQVPARFLPVPEQREETQQPSVPAGRGLRTLLSRLAIR
jgi:hypothetical protein